MEFNNTLGTRPAATPRQCDIVKTVYAPRLGETNCCEKEVSSDFIDAPLVCLRGGWPHWVLDTYQFDYEWVDGRFDDWDAVKTELCHQHPFISVIAWNGGGKHTLVVHGYRESPTGVGLQRVVEIDDPNKDDDPEDLTFEEFVEGSFKRQGEFYEFSHDRTYVQIAPLAKDQP
ncbi:MAG TPA: hypothetical protein PKD12_01190 [Nitrospira sp.]|nr:hypothetical protein [Nitrospira sp.]